MIDQNVYCSMIHGGLQLTIKNGSVETQVCCMGPRLPSVTTGVDIWHNPKFLEIRNLNLENKWHPACHGCKKIEDNGHDSLRTGSNKGLGIYGRTNLSGPARIDLMFDISCNLACRTCSADLSTFWQKHLKEHGRWPGPIFTPRNKDVVINALAQLDLSNLRMLVFCGGETLLGNEYWQVAEWLVDNVPNAKENLTLCFQTNGTQPILDRHYHILERAHLAKLHISIDGVEQKFEYLRWPADWNQMTENILKIKETCPSNVMFLIEETVSIFNLFYLDQTELWYKKNFATNRFGNPVELTRHLALGDFGLHHVTQEYIDAVKNTQFGSLINSNWKEDPHMLTRIMARIKRYDGYRKQNFAETFPEVAEFYRRYW